MDVVYLCSPLLLLQLAIFFMIRNEEKKSGKLQHKEEESQFSEYESYNKKMKMQAFWLLLFLSLDSGKTSNMHFTKSFSYWAMSKAIPEALNDPPHF